MFTNNKNHLLFSLLYNNLIKYSIKKSNSKPSSPISESSSLEDGQSIKLLPVLTSAPACWLASLLVRFRRSSRQMIPRIDEELAAATFLVAI